MNDAIVVNEAGHVHVGKNQWVSLESIQQKVAETQKPAPLNLAKRRTEPFHPLNVNECNEEPLPLPCMVSNEPMELPYMVSNGSGEEHLPLPSSAIVRNETKQTTNKVSCDCEHLELPSTYRKTK